MTFAIKARHAYTRRAITRLGVFHRLSTNQRPVLLSQAAGSNTNKRNAMGLDSVEAGDSRNN